MVVYYLNKVSERLADYRYPIKEGDICMLYDGEKVKTIYVDNETEVDSIWRDFKFIDSKSLKSYHLPKTDCVICAPIGDKRAIGNTRLLTQLIQECKGEWLLDFLTETSAVLSGFVDYWDLMVLRRLIGEDDIEIEYGDEKALTAFIGKLDENDIVKVDDDEYADVDTFSPKNDIKWFCLSALSCIKNEMDERCYQILYDTLKGDSKSEIASKFHLTQERIRQIVAKATEQANEVIIAQHKSFEETKAENTKLKAQIDLLKENIANLKDKLPRDDNTEQKSVDENISSELAELLETPIANIALSLRATKTLMYMGIKKFAEIPRIESEVSILNVRNSGRKTVHDILQMLDDFHLSLGMSFANILDILKINDWHSAKRKWIVESKNETGTNNLSHLNITKSVQEAVDIRIGDTVRIFPSQLKGEIVRTRTDSKGIKKLVVKTTGGQLVEINDFPFLYEVLKKGNSLINRNKQQEVESFTPTRKYSALTLGTWIKWKPTNEIGKVVRFLQKGSLHKIVVRKKNGEEIDVYDNPRMYEIIK